MKRVLWLATFFLTFLLAGCVGAQSGELVVDSAWARPSPQGAPASAFYMIIDNDTERQDVLLHVRSDVCDAVEIHRTSIDEEGVMRMAPVPAGQLVIPAGESMILAPGGLHVMCVGLAEPLLEGQEVLLTLDFEVAGSIAVSAGIRQEAP